MNHKNTWMLVFDAKNANFYHYDRHHIDCFKAMTPEFKHAHLSLTSNSRCDYTRNLPDKEIQIQAFVRQIQTFLDHARMQKNYRHLILVAAPHMMGRLTHGISKHVARLVDYRLCKDGMHQDDRHLLSWVNRYVALH